MSVLEMVGLPRENWDKHGYNGNLIEHYMVIKRCSEKHPLLKKNVFVSYKL
jgi:hypothetical protein